MCMGTLMLRCSRQKISVMPSATAVVTSGECLKCAKKDEKLKLPLVVAGQRRSVNFVTENGLYNILAQSRMEIARSWRRVVHDELINMRKEKGRNIAEQFEEWDHDMDNIYFDEETGQLMQSVTVPGGDVIQIPYEKEEE